MDLGRELFGLVPPATEAERRQTIPMWWLVVSGALAFAVGRVVEANVDHHRGLISTGAIMVTIALTSAPGWLVVLRLRGSQPSGPGSSDPR